jgi:hypothetical protein
MVDSSSEQSDSVDVPRSWPEAGKTGFLCFMQPAAGSEAVAATQLFVSHYAGRWHGAVVGQQGRGPRSTRCPLVCVRQRLIGACLSAYRQARRDSVDGCSGTQRPAGLQRFATLHDVADLRVFVSLRFASYFWRKAPPPSWKTRCGTAVRWHIQMPAGLDSEWRHGPVSGDEGRRRQVRAAAHRQRCGALST